MSLHVGFEGRGPYESRTADVALKRSFARVRAHMIVQVSVRREGHTTNLAFEGFDAAVDPHVDFHVAALSESLVAHWALERLNALVRAYVDLQPAGARVGLRAVRTLVGQLTGVNQFVGLEVAPRYKSLTAALKSTHERSLPCLQAQGCR